MRCIGTLFLMFRARLAYFNVLTDSFEFRCAGDTHALFNIGLVFYIAIAYRKKVRLFPPNASCNSRVKRDDLYGTNCDESPF